MGEDPPKTGLYVKRCTQHAERNPAIATNFSVVGGVSGQKDFLNYRICIRRNAIREGKGGCATLELEHPNTTRFVGTVMLLQVML
ncbi:MAG TPA: hypothetical protein VFF30_01585 [Nitrososphaerales archaeon]|nr:hypothetical protein [Nitrososphaerales archaeon]